MTKYHVRPTTNHSGKPKEKSRKKWHRAVRMALPPGWPRPSPQHLLWSRQLGTQHASHVPRGLLSQPPQAYSQGPEEQRCRHVAPKTLCPALSRRRAGTTACLSCWTHRWLTRCHQVSPKTGRTTEGEGGSSVRERLSPQTKGCWLQFQKNRATAGSQTAGRGVGAGSDPMDAQHTVQYWEHGSCACR